jgi:hypothetical protein
MPRFGSADPGVLQLGAHSLESGNQNHGCSVWAALNKEAKQDRGVNGRSVTSRCEHNQSSFIPLTCNLLYSGQIAPVYFPQSSTKDGTIRYPINLIDI